MGGQIPAAIGLLSNLRVLALSENNFDGTLPVELGDLTALEVLAIQREGGTAAEDVGVNQGLSEDRGVGLSGPLLPFEKLRNLRQLYLGVNSLSGTVPYNFLDGIEARSENIEVDLIGNSLNGAFAGSFVTIRVLDYVYW